MKHYEAGGFKVGDWVKVVNYGSVMWIHKEMVKKMEDVGLLQRWNQISETETSIIYDSAPYRIGTIDFIEQIKETQGQIKFALSKSAWYNLDQLEKIDDSERLKWFESPNAEGYLDM